MAGRNEAVYQRRSDAALAEALQALAQAVANQQAGGVDADARNLATFQRENPPTFKGRYNPDGALAWLKEIERIFRVMNCSAAQKVRLGTHKLAEEADNWWLGARQRLEATEEEITWDIFKREFMRKYYPEDVRGKKETEFLELKQGNKSVADYAAKFVELAEFYPHFNNDNGEFSKCVRFENGLRPDIKQAIGYQRIRVFSDLVECCRIYEEDTNARFRVMKEKRDQSQYRSKPYEVPTGKGKPEVTGDTKPSGGDAAARVVCYKCGRFGHKSDACRVGTQVCYRCGKEGHRAAECERREVTCYTCGESGHVSSKCPKPKKEGSSGRVFCLVGSETTDEIGGDR